MSTQPRQSPSTSMGMVSASIFQRVYASARRPKWALARS